MKRLFVLSAIILMSVSSVFAQEKKDNNWKEKMRSEKIAFLTGEMNLTPEEAQVFWPVYNAVRDERDKAQREVVEAYRALNESVKAGNSEIEISGLLDNYVKSISNKAKMADRHTEEFKKVLPIEKVAILYLSEEKFRREQIHRLHNGCNQRRPQGGR